jgi:hypothetical protein
MESGEVSKWDSLPLVDPTKFTSDNGMDAILMELCIQSLPPDQPPPLLGTPAPPSESSPPKLALTFVNPELSTPPKAARATNNTDVADAECVQGLAPDLSGALLDLLQKTIMKRRGRPPGTRDSKPRCKKLPEPVRSNQRGRPLGSRDAAPRRKPGAIFCIKVYLFHNHLLRSPSARELTAQKCNAFGRRNANKGRENDLQESS